MPALLVSQVRFIAEKLVECDAASLSVKVDSRSHHTYHPGDSAYDLLTAVGDDPYNKLSVIALYEDDFRLWFTCEANSVVSRPNRLTFKVDSLTIESGRSPWRHTYNGTTTVTISLDHPTSLTFASDFVRSLHEMDAKAVS